MCVCVCRWVYVCVGVCLYVFIQPHSQFLNGVKLVSNSKFFFYIGCLIKVKELSYPCIYVIVNLLKWHMIANIFRYTFKML